MPWRHGCESACREGRERGGRAEVAGCLERAGTTTENPASWNNDGEDADGMMKDEGRE